jgi:hypothetical protein
MRDYTDEPMYRTFEEFEREELRRADSVGAAVEEMFDTMLSDDLDFDATAVRLSKKRHDADDEE